MLKAPLVLAVVAISLSACAWDVIAERITDRDPPPPVPVVLPRAQYVHVDPALCQPTTPAAQDCAAVDGGALCCAGVNVGAVYVVDGACLVDTGNACE